MAMPLFVSADDVILRMQLQSQLDGITDVVNSAIKAAQLQLQSALDGKLQQQTIDCRFFLDKNAFSGLQPGGVFRLEVPSGFIRSDSDLTVTFDTKWNMPAPQAVDSTLMVVENERGYVLLDSCQYGNKYIRVQCQTGFKASVPTPSFTGTTQPYDNTVAYTPGTAVTITANNQTVTYLCTANTQGNTPPNDSYWTLVTYGPESLPDDLYEAILSYVPSIFDASQTTNRDPQAIDQYRKAAERSFLLLKPYMRVTGFSFRPMLVTAAYV